MAAALPADELMRTLILLAGLAALAGPGAAGADDSAPPAGAMDLAAVASGRAVFERVCAPCHGRGPGLDGSPMLPGAAALAAKHQGAVSPFLEDRSDLSAEVIRAFVRHGSGTMPMFRKTEISDAEIVAVAAYLATAARAAHGSEGPLTAR
jgi:mono/diheme cytochrome c family protein